MTNSRLLWAQCHFENGYSPIPTIPGTKGACIPWKPYQTSRPTMLDLLEWWPDGTTRNMALVTGAFSGHVVVDADDEESVRFARVHFDPTPYRVRTRRGMHFYYRHPGPGTHVQTKPKVFGEDGLAVDVKGDGGICTGLGSIHASGYIYALDDGARIVPVHELPLWSNLWVPSPRVVVAPALSHVPNGTNLERAERYLDKITEGFGKGGRNQGTFRVCAAVVRDFALSEEQGWALMSAWNAQKNDPPLSEDDLRVIVKSCLVSGRSAVGAKLGQGGVGIYGR